MAHCNTDPCRSTQSTVDGVLNCACPCQHCGDERLRQVLGKQKEEMNKLREQLEELINQNKYPLKLPRS
ncbi:hypothetical protein WME88_34350 [Sorangium sp. So ce216]